MRVDASSAWLADDVGGDGAIGFGDYLSLSSGATKTYDSATNVCTLQKAVSATYGDITTRNGAVILYGGDEEEGKKDVKRET